MSDKISMWTDAEQQALLALGDLFIQGGAGMPKASDAADFLNGTERVCGIRPDLIDTAKDIIAQLGPVAGWTVDGIRDRFPEQFSDFGELLAGAYFLDERVMSGLDYLDHPTIPLGNEQLRVEEMRELIQPVIARGNIFRETPPQTSARTESRQP